MNYGIVGDVSHLQLPFAHLMAKVKGQMKIAYNVLGFHLFI